MEQENWRRVASNSRGNLYKKVHICNEIEEDIGGVHLEFKSTAFRWNSEFRGRHSREENIIGITLCKSLKTSEMYFLK